MTNAIRRLSAPSEFALINAVCFGYFIIRSASILLAGETTRDVTTTQAFAAIAFELTVALVAMSVLYIRGWRLADFDLSPSFRRTAAGALLALAVVSFYGAVMVISHAAGYDIRELSRYSFSQSAALLPLILFVLTNSLFEELFVTGYIIRALQGNGGVAAIAVSTFVRVAYHLYQGPLVAFSILPLGVIFGIAYWRSRRLWPLVVGHTAINLVAMVID